MIYVDIEQRNYDYAVKRLKDISKALDMSFKEAKKLIDDFIITYSEDNMLSVQQARKTLTIDEYNDYIDYVVSNERATRTSETLSQDATRIDSLIAKLYIALSLCFDDEASIIDDILKHNYASRYTETIEAINATIANINISTEVNDVKMMASLEKIFFSDNLTRYDRINNFKNQLLYDTKQQVIKQFVMNKSVSDATREMHKFIDAKHNISDRRASTLAITENACVCSDATRDAYDAAQVTMYKIVAVIDNKTSEICLSMDGHVFDTNDYEVGVTAPPFHANCRSTTAPYFL